jgi:hypothetical protein
VALLAALAAGGGFLVVFYTANWMGAPAAEPIAVDAGVHRGEIAVEARVERHWTEWNGKYALLGHRATPVNSQSDLPSFQLLIPSFTYAKFDERQVEQLRQGALRFARDTGMQVEIEPRFGFFQARFLSTPSALALVPGEMAYALALDSATGVQRLSLRHEAAASLR